MSEDKVKPQLEWPDYMYEYPLEFWEDAKVIEYVKLAHEYLVTLRQLKKKRDTL